MNRFVGLIGVALVVGGCGRVPRHRVEISDVTQPTTLVLTPTAGNHKPINYLTLQIRGHINGHAEVSFGETQTNIVGSRFTIRRTGNYEGTKCVVRYIPRQVTAGSVTVSYAFD